MRGRLERLASEVGLELDWRRVDEAYAQCPDSQFRDRFTALADSATLADLFATTSPKARSRLTAVFQVEGDPAWLLLTTELGGSAFPSLTPGVHAASWYEREIFEMHGLEPVGHPAPGPLRLHDWPEDHHPMRDRPVEAVRFPHPPHVIRRPTVTGQGVFQLPLGPVRSGPQESAEFLFSSGGEDIVVLDLRLGFKYRAIERLAQGQPADRAVQLAERLAGTSAFANGLAYTQAVERAIGASVSPVTEHSRALLGELERLGSHFGTLGRLAEATGLLVASAQYGLLKEEALRTAGRLTGHRYLRGALRIGGMEVLLAAGARDHLRAQLDVWSERSAGLTRLLEQTSTFIDRLDTTAQLLPEYASEHHLVGPVGRASGIDRDVRRDHPYAAYPAVDFDVPTVADGDAEARFQVHGAELAQSLAIMGQLLDGWPTDPDQTEPPAWHAGTALGWAEAPGGETLHSVVLDQVGRVLRWRARPPAVVNWHAFAHACGSGNNLTDYPVIEASFSLSAAEFDR
ncbi:MAG TPA: NADH-quinone oxidoreductase subunit C [Candidatus Dormibacteraeota bacterium]|nr:NADH-quinone oxidoreductase subunit C [Candidatus Dormibacteraeota bacterium]